MRWGATTPYVRELDFLSLGVTKTLRSGVRFLTFGGHKYLRLGVTNPYVRGLDFLGLGATNP